MSPRRVATMSKQTILVALCLMLGVSLAATEDEARNLQPCPFNPLCRCSRGGPEVGLIFCEDIPLADIPAGINSTRAFAIYLKRNGLRRIEDNLLHRTGIWRIDIRNNHLAYVPDMAFAGLERSLGELDLPYNRLQRVPSKALRNLEKLKILDLGGNQIVDVVREDFSGIEDTLQVLSLADNYLAALNLETFQGFQKLERLDLRGNSIMTVLALPSGSMKLSHLNLADNSLERIPFASLAQIRSLSTVNLASNRLINTYDELFKSKLSIDTLIVDNNLISSLPAQSFRNFQFINRTSLTGNNIKVIEEDAFKDAKIRELILSDCALYDIDEKAFRGLEGTLQTLDLSFNNLSSLPEKLFEKLDSLVTLRLNDNPLAFDPEEVLNVARSNLQSINLIGEKMGKIPYKNLNVLRNLRSIGFTSLDEKVSADDFEGFGAALEHMNLAKNRLKSLGSGAFRHVPGIKSLDLSENRISQIENDAFAEIGTSLTKLYMANSVSMSSLPPEPFKKLVALHSIDVSNNRLSSIPPAFFNTMKDLRSINLQDNNIDKIPPNMFNDEHTPNLVNLTLSFNSIGTIETQTFADLSRLRLLDLEDNKITQIAKGAFQNIDNLEAILMEGNHIDSINAEAFHNLPKLEVLNLAYNRLAKLSFDWLDQVGTLSAIKLDLSHNLIQQLVSNQTGFSSYASIRVLDLGHNNISFISRHFFEPIRSSLSQLILNNNYLKNISRDVYSDMEHLQWLDLSHNRIQLVDSDAFSNARRLQVLLLNNNDIGEIYQDMLSSSSTLRVINISNNKLRFLPDTLFKDTQLEILDVSHNQITKIPDGCLSRIAHSLRHLDVSHNEIVAISPDQLKRLTNLVYLDLSHNDIAALPERAFETLKRLAYLDLSSNPIQIVAEHMFDNLIQSLVHLNLAHVGHVDLGDFHLPELVSLNISRNTVDNLPSDFFTRYANLKELDISHCDLTILHESPWSTASKLRALHLNGNNLTTITNGTLASMKSLEYLNIQDLPLIVFEEGSLYQMTNLRHLAIGTYEQIKGLNIPKMLEYNLVLKHLEIDIESSSFESQLHGKLPFKVSNITLSGSKLKSIANNALRDFQGRFLNLRLRNNAVGDIPRAFFQNLGNTRWLQLDVQFNELASVSEPSTSVYPGSHGSVFLTNLHMASNPLKCDCSVGWVEFWMRKWRQFLCKDRCGNYHSLVRNLREARCKNRDKDLVAALKNDLECGWSSSTAVMSNLIQVTTVIFAGLAVVQRLKAL